MPLRSSDAEVQGSWAIWRKSPSQRVVRKRGGMHAELYAPNLTESNTVRGGQGSATQQRGPLPFIHFSCPTAALCFPSLSTKRTPADCPSSRSDPHEKNRGKQSTAGPSVPLPLAFMTVQRLLAQVSHVTWSMIFSISPEAHNLCITSGSWEMLCVQGTLSLYDSKRNGFVSLALCQAPPQHHPPHKAIKSILTCFK